MRFRLMQFNSIRPSKFRLDVAALVGILCLALAFFLFLGVAKIENDNTIRVKVPGTAIIEIEKAGKYTVYFEYDSYSGGEVYETNGITDGLFTLTNKTTKEQIDLKSAIGKEGYSTDGRTGESIANFKINAPGQYILKTKYVMGSGESQCLAIRPSFGSQMSTVIMMLLAISLVCLAIMIPFSLFMLRIWNKRRKRQNDFNTGSQNF